MKCCYFNESRKRLLKDMILRTLSDREKILVLAMILIESGKFFYQSRNPQFSSRLGQQPMTHLEEPLSSVTSFE